MNMITTGVGLRGRLLYRMVPLLFLLLHAMQPAKGATTITIGKATGIVWEGLPFSGSWNGPTFWDTLGNWGIAVISVNTSSTNSGLLCLKDSQLTMIGGYKAFKIANGVGIIPRANVSVTYNMISTGTETLTGTIGIPETRGTTSTGYTITNPSYNYNNAWCLSVRQDMTPNGKFVERLAARTASMSGSWVVVADGTQTSQEVTLPSIYGGTYSGIATGVLKKLIFPSNVILRVSNLACSIATTTAINFGDVSRDTTAGSELASLSFPMAVSCSQSTDRVSANINVQFLANSGLYSNNTRRLALNQGGGYITGEISGGVTGSGACNLNTGIPFDSTPLKVGAITSDQNISNSNNQVTWRLCSGGANLPLGAVTASTEMFVTFN